MSKPAPIAAVVADVLRQLRADQPDVAYGPVLTPREAAAYLRMSERGLQDRADIPRVDIAAPGTERAMWRYRRADLETFIAKRLLNAWKEPAA